MRNASKKTRQGGSHAFDMTSTCMRTLPLKRHLDQIPSSHKKLKEEKEDPPHEKEFHNIFAIIFL
jgi:hypothetical protein